MIPVEKIERLLGQMSFDVRLEVILAELVNGGVSMDNVVVMSNSLFRRNYHRDIENAGEIEYEQSRKKRLYFIVNREGLYDHIPEDLFHQPPEPGHHADKEDVIREIKVQEEVEKNARLFFQPVEQEFYRQRVKLALEEQFFLSGDGPDMQHDLFSDLWDLPVFFDSVQKGKLGRLMPVLHKITADISLLPFIVTYITGYRIEVEETAPCSYLLLDEPLLGSMQLGIDYVLGGEVAELQWALKIKIFLGERDKLMAFMPGGDKIKMFEFLVRLLVSYEKDVVYELEFPEETGFVISEEQMSNEGRLNYTTVI